VLGQGEGGRAEASDGARRASHPARSAADPLEGGSMIDPFAISAQLLLGWLIADLLSGFVHWVEDRVLWVGMPLISKSVVEPNRRHHRDPQAFLYQSVLARNGTSWAAVAVIAAAWLWLAGFSWVLAGALAGGLAVTEIHVRTHRAIVRTSWYRALQDIGIVQSRAHHVGHHADPMDSRYCVLTDWLNPLLDRIGLWARLEAGLGALGVRTNRDAA
jgi:ubiquitin-conjugating enzyme E2 variant